MKTKRLLIVLGSVCLALVLAVPLVVSCAAPDTTPTTTPTTPVVVQKIKQQCICPWGVDLSTSQLFAEQIEIVTDGRYEVELVLGEAIVPTEEIYEATRDGIFQLAHGYGGYYKEKLPLLAIEEFGEICLRYTEDGWRMFEHWGWNETHTQAYAGWNMVPLAYAIPKPSDCIFSKYPIPDFESLAGMKFRSYGGAAMLLEAAGAETVWLPGAEIYTALASGLVDACTYGNASHALDMGFNEVTSYWVENPAPAAVNVQSFIANMDFWDSLSAADQAALKNVAIACARYQEEQGTWEAVEGMRKARDLGIEIISWSSEDINQLTGVAMSLIPEVTDPLAQESLDGMLDYMRFMGYID